MTSLLTSSYNQQRLTWPQSGRHIMAQYDDRSVVVYQAYKPSIGRFAAQHDYFGGDFSFTRMSWIKPNFLWMMYRSGWGTKPNQEITLAIRLKRPFFDAILRAAVPSSYTPHSLQTHADWKAAVASSDVRLQWDPDHNPLGEKENRRAIQLGLRREMLDGFRGDGIISIEDISEFVTQQHTNLKQSKYTQLSTPTEAIYPIDDTHIRQTLEMDFSS